MSDLEKLQEANARLTALLEDPQPGLTAWIQAVERQCRALARVAQLID